MLPISLCMIAKNEEKVLERCLKSVHDWVSEIVLVDTGSTDSTIKIAKSFEKTKILEADFIDFSQSRNISLGSAKEEWILILDADEYCSVHAFDELKRAISSERSYHALWRLNFLPRGGVNMTPITRLIRRSAGYCYKKEYGESLNYSIMEKENIPCLKDEINAVIYHDGYLLSERRLLEKLNRGIVYASQLLARGKSLDNTDRYYLGLNLAHLGRIGEARDVAKSGLKEDSNSHLLRKLMALICFSEGNTSEGTHYYRSVVQDYPFDYSIQMAYAKHLFLTGFFSEAIAMYQDIDKLFNCHVVARHNYARVVDVLGAQALCKTEFDLEFQAEYQKAKLAEVRNGIENLVSYEFINEMLHE